MNRRSFLKSFVAGALALVGVRAAKTFQVRVDGGPWHTITAGGSTMSSATIDRLGTGTSTVDQWLTVPSHEWHDALAKTNPGVTIYFYNLDAPSAVEEFLNALRARGYD